MTDAWPHIAICLAGVSAALPVGWFAGKYFREKAAAKMPTAIPAEPSDPAGENLLAALLGVTGDAIVQKDINDKWQVVNRAALNMLKIPHDRLIGLTTDEIAASYPQVYSNPLCDIDADREAWAADMPIAREVPFERHSGHVRTMEVVRVPSGQPGSESIVIVARDITTRKEAEESAQASEQFARLAMDSLSSNICILDQHGQIIFVNHSWKLFSHERPPIVPYYGEGMNYVSVCNAAETVDSLNIAGGIESVLKGKTPSYVYEYRCYDYADPSRSYCNILKATRCDVGGKLHVVVSHEDITERKTSEDNALYAATHDTMTGLYNRAFYEAELERFSLSRNPVGIILLDLDNLKKANDGYGHEEGDRLICRAAVCLKRALRGGEVVARIGGDEFVAIVDNASSQILSMIVNRIREQETVINNSHPPHPVKLGMSIGVGLADGPVTVQEAVRAADKMMYIEKGVRKKMFTAS